MLKDEHYITTHFYCYKTGIFYQAMLVTHIISHNNCCSRIVYCRDAESLFSFGTQLRL